MTQQVYLASAAPPVRHPNVYGVDMPNRKEFVAHGLTEDQVSVSANWSFTAGLEQVKMHVPQEQYINCVSCLKVR